MLHLWAYSLFVSLVASFAPSLRQGANDTTRTTNKVYALQNSCDCLIIWSIAVMLRDSVAVVVVVCTPLAMVNSWVSFPLLYEYGAPSYRWSSADNLKSH